MKHWLTSIVVILVVLIVGAFGYQYIIDKQTYVSTNNATVEADMYTITATQTGVLSKWTVKDGDTVTGGNVIGQIDSSPKQSIATAITGSIIKTSVFQQQTVFQGQALAKVADITKAYVLAYINEDQVGEIKLGKDVKITIESLSNDPFDGKVMEIGTSTGDVYQSTTLPTKQETEKVIKRVPVKISVNDLPFNRLSLGVHAEVKIEK